MADPTRASEIPSDAGVLTLTAGRHRPALALVKPLPATPTVSGKGR